MQFLNAQQRELVEAPLTAKIFLEGPAGCGKTAVGVARLAYLLDAGVSGDEILVLVPQRTLAEPYYDVILDPNLVPGGAIDILTIGGLARKMVELFWPLIVEDAGFGHPDLPPTFLNIETAQYHMARIVEPLLDKGYFDGITIDRNRLFSQILDNLNKAAFVGFRHTEIKDLLSSAWIDQDQPTRIFGDVQECANSFRAYCLAHNLLDFSLVLDVFIQRLWPDPVCFEYLTSRYRFLIVDNIEEDTPVTHDFLSEWIGDFESALVIYDWEAGFRRFLGADPVSAGRLRGFCSHHSALTESFVTSEDVEGIRVSAATAFGRKADGELVFSGDGLYFESKRFYPEMLGWVSQNISDLVDQGVEPRDIVVLAPFLSDALRFSLMDLLRKRDIPVQSHRPSRSLREEPAVLCLLTLAAVTFPQWGVRPSVFDMAIALRQAIEGMDLVRAQLLAEILFRNADGVPELSSFENLKPDMQARVTYVLGGKYEALWHWIEAYSETGSEALDLFLSQLFGEVLSQPGYGFHSDFDAGKAAANLIDSAREFRWVIGPQLEERGEDIGAAFLQMVQGGVLASQYIPSWEFSNENAVLLAPAYTFLMKNEPVDFQFWLNVSSSGWGERLFQPLTHPYVLSRNWEPGRIWTDADEVRTNQEGMFVLVNGLLRRCRKGVFLGLSDMDEHGYEQKGPLMGIIQHVLRSKGES